MKFTAKKPKENIANLARILGYQFSFFKNTSENEFSLIRPLVKDYPRFHLYLKEDRESNLLALNLHLDQKKPSYGHETAHSGEYNGELVGAERQRIEQILTK